MDHHGGGLEGLPAPLAHEGHFVDDLDAVHVVAAEGQGFRGVFQDQAGDDLVRDFLTIVFDQADAHDPTEIFQSLDQGHGLPAVLAGVAPPVVSDRVQPVKAIQAGAEPAVPPVQSDHGPAITVAQVESLGGTPYGFFHQPGGEADSGPGDPGPGAIQNLQGPRVGYLHPDPFQDIQSRSVQARYLLIVDQPELGRETEFVNIHTYLDHRPGLSAVRFKWLRRPARFN